MDGQVIAKRHAQALLMELGSDFEFFHTPDRDPFASVCVDRHLETVPVASREFAHVLRHLYYRRTSSAPPKQALEDAISVFASRALFAGTEQQVFLRVAERDGKTYLDLADPDWNAVEISAARMEPRHESSGKVLAFTRYAGAADILWPGPTSTNYGLS